MPPIWAVRCSGSHCVNTFFVTVTLTFDLVTWKSIGVICESRSMYLWSVMILGKSVLELSSENHFTISGHRDLDLVTSKSIRVICESWSIYLWSFMILGICVLELSSENHFTISGHRDLDLWPSDLKINRGHLQVMINLAMKFHDPRRMNFWVIIRKPFYYFGSPWPWPLTSKSIGVICESWSMYLWSFMILGPSVLELSSDNHLVDGPTNWHTDRPTDMSKAIYPLFFEGGHNEIKVHLQNQSLSFWKPIDRIITYKKYTIFSTLINKLKHFKSYNLHKIQSLISQKLIHNIERY